MKKSFKNKLILYFLLCTLVLSSNTTATLFLETNEIEVHNNQSNDSVDKE